MRDHNSVSLFIYVLVAELFFYFIANIYAIKMFGGFTDIFFAAAFCITLLGLLIASFKQTERRIRLYYYLLWIVSLIFVYIYIFNYASFLPVLRYYFVLAVLIALLLSIMDDRAQRVRKRVAAAGSGASYANASHYSNASHAPYTPGSELERQRWLREKEYYKQELDKQTRKLEDLKAYTESLRAVKEKYQLDSEDKLLKLAQTREELDRLSRETEMVGKRLSDGMRYKQELEKKEGLLAQKSRKMEEERKRLSELEKKHDALKKVLGKAVNEAERQAELKQKYSKTLRNIQKAKKEDEALLVVSPDGKSVHRPACIAVRNISKENRTLIPNWKEAKKLNYKGCKLCKPHEENDFVIRNGSKFRFVVSRDSDKIHKTNCTVLKSISESDKQYMRSYKQAVKKGYTPCRVCNPKQ